MTPIARDQCAAITTIRESVCGPLRQGPLKIADELFGFLYTAVSNRAESAPGIFISAQRSRDKAAKELLKTGKESKRFKDDVTRVAERLALCRPDNPKLMPPADDRIGVACVLAFIAGVPHLVFVRGPAAKHRDPDGPEDYLLRLVAEFRPISPILAEQLKITAEGSHGPYATARQARPRFPRHVRRALFATLMFIAVASIAGVLIVRQRRDAAERRAHNAVEVRRLLDEAGDALGGHPGTRLVDDPPGYDRARADQYEVARRKIEQAAILDPTNTRAANIMGVYYKVTGDLTKAAAFFNKAILLEPTNEEALSNMADVLSLQGKMDAALDYYRRAIAVKPNFAPAYIGQAVVYLHRCCSEPLHPAFEDLLGIEDDIQYEIAAEKRMPEFHLQVENYLRDLEAAHNAALSAVDYAPHDADSYRILGNVLDYSGDAAGAANAYQNALRIAPEDPYVRYDYGVALFRSQNFADATTQFVRAIKINHNYAKAFAALSVALQRLKKDVLATAALLEANRLAPDNKAFAELLRKRTESKPDLVSAAKANSHAFDDDLAAYLVHDLEPQGTQQPTAQTPAKTSS